MESLFKPPRTRKNSSSFSGPYDGVLLPNRGQKTPSLDYVEIFSGSPSSIPVLDLSGLETGAARQRARSSSSKVDYTSIFGGFRNDDVAAPYEELFDGGSSNEKKTVKPRPTTSSSYSRSPQQESASQHSSEKTQTPSTDPTDQSADGVQKHFNMSFNKTSQVNTDSSNGKTHIAQLHAVPGFAYFVDGAPQIQETEQVVVPSLKREVSRTWSFSAEIGKVKSGSTHDKQHRPNNKSGELNETRLKPQCLNVPNPPDDVKGRKKSRIPEIVSNGESSEKINQTPPTFSDEEYVLDENSAAVELKKAIDQAQEIITIAKMIMERKKKGGRESRPKARSRSRWKVKDVKETRTELEEAFGYNMEKDDGENYESFDSDSNRVGRKFSSPSGPDFNFVSRGKDDAYQVPENVEISKVRGEAFDENKMSSSYTEKVVTEKENVEKATKFEGSFGGISNRLPASHDRLMVKEEKIVENVLMTEVCNEETSSLGLIVPEETIAVNLKHVNERIRENITLASNKFESRAQEMESEKGKLEHVEDVIHHRGGPEAVAELVGSEIETSGNLLNVDEFVDQSSEEGRETFYDSTGPESMAEVISTSHQVMIERQRLNEADEILGINQEDGFLGERENVMENKENNENKPAEIEKLVNLENLTSLRSDYDDDLSNDPCKFPEIAVIEEDGKEQHTTPCEFEEEHLNEHNVDSMLIGSEEQADDVLMQNSNETEPDVIPEVDEIETEVMGSTDSEFNVKKPDVALVRDEPNKPVELEEVEFNVKRINTDEDKAAETIHVEANNCAEVQKSEASSHAIETNCTSEEEELRNEESNNECKLHEDACESGASIEAGAQSPNDVNEVHENDTIPFVGTHDPDFTDVKHQKIVDGCEEESVIIPEIIQTFATVDGDQEPNKSTDSEDDEMHGTEHLDQSSLEEIITEIKLQNDFGRVSFAGTRPEDDGLIDESHDEMPDDEENDIHKESQEYAYMFNNPYLTKSLYSNLNRAGCDFVDVTKAPEEVQDAEEALSTSSFENMDALSTHKSEENAEELKEETSDKDEQKYEPEIIANDRQNNKMEDNEVERDQETEKPLETEPKMEKKENLSEISSMKEKGNKENTQDFNKVDHQQRIEAIKREKEREKNRVAAERAIREARERAFAEARERAERAAVERATAEARQRVLAEAKERLEKSSTSTTKQKVDKISNEAKLKAERAAVEKVLAEARERALEKAISQKNKTQVDNSGTSRGKELKHSFSSPDLENINGANTESALRNKARLERHQRIMERVAKALAEKNMRDLIAQKEQAERNRLSESLDAEIKRWAAGKEGNLRALLSTLQYILGPKSGWQPISLTEIITTAAVKKAYRKATLYVHPDKLQQRGASIQQKYTCEKVFDLLKAAWNKFNSEER